MQQVAAAKDLAPRLSTAEAQLATAEASLAKVARSSRMFFVVLRRLAFSILRPLWSVARCAKATQAWPSNGCACMGFF